jgi:hypothetical protein
LPFIWSTFTPVFTFTAVIIENSLSLGLDHQDASSYHNTLVPLYHYVRFWSSSSPRTFDGQADGPDQQDGSSLSEHPPRHEALQAFKNVIPQSLEADHCCNFRLR